MKTATFEFGKQYLAEWIEQNRDCEKMVLVGEVYCNLWDENFQYKVKGKENVYGFRREINIGWHSYDLLFGFNKIAKDFHPAEFDITDMHLLDYEGNVNDEDIPEDADEEQPSMIFKMLVNRKYSTRFVFNDGILTTPDRKVLVHHPDTEHVVVPEGIETIGRLAFAAYEKMQKIDLPTGLKEFGDNSFSSVENLEELNMPETVERLGEGAFCYADIGIIRVSDRIETFPPYCFRYCTIDRLPSSLKTVEDDNCFHFGEEGDGVIEFPYGFEHLGSYAFTEFEQVRLPATTKYIAEDFWYDYIVGGDDDRKPAIVIDPDNPYFAVEGINKLVYKCVTDDDIQRDFSRRAIGYVASDTERNYLLEKDVLLSPKEMINLVEMSQEPEDDYKKWFYWALEQTTLLTEQERLLLTYLKDKWGKMWAELHGNFKTRIIAAFGVCYDYKDPSSGEQLGYKEVLLGKYPHSLACMDDMRKKDVLKNYDKIICRQYKAKDKALEEAIGSFELEKNYSPVNNEYYLADYPVPKEIENIVDSYIDIPHPFGPGDIVKLKHYPKQYVVAESFKPTKEQIESKYVDSSDMAVTVLPKECSEIVRECIRQGKKIPEELFSKHDHLSFLRLEMVEKFNNLPMKKTPIQKAEEYLQKAKDILANTPVVDEFDDDLLLHYADVKNIKKAGRTAWKGCSIALNYALEKNIETYDYKAYEEETLKIGDRLYVGFDIAYYALAIYMSVDGNQSKNICDDGMERAEYLIDMCKNIQSVIKQIEEEKRDREERQKKFNSTKREDRCIVKRQSKELFELLLEKTGTKRKDLIEIAFQEFVCDNIYLLTPEEKKRFDYLVF